MKNSSQEEIRNEIETLKAKKDGLLNLLNKQGVEYVNQNEIDDKYLTKEVPTDENFILAGSGHYFRKDKKGMFPFMMQKIYNDRVKVKKEMISDKKKLELIKRELEKRNEKL